MAIILKVGDIVICRTHGAKTELRIDGFVDDALGVRYAALTMVSTGKPCGTLRVTLLKRAPVATVAKPKGLRILGGATGAQPTPGPWKADGPIVFYVNKRNNGEGIGRFGDLHTSDVDRANAELAAKAPEFGRIVSLLASFVAEGADSISFSALMEGSDTETLADAVRKAVR